MPDAVVVISTYNGERYLARQIESIMGQTVVDWELIVRDDGSSDGTLLLLDAFAASDSRVTVYRGANVGVVRSFFALLALAADRGSVIVFADQDDVWMPDRLAHQCAALAGRPGPALTYAPVRLIDEADHVLPRQHPAAAFPRFETMLVQNQIPGCAIAINRAAAELVLTHLPDPAAVIMHDWWLLLVIAGVGEIIPTGLPLVDYRQHGANVVGIRTGWTGLRHRIDRVLRQPGHRLLEQAEQLAVLGDLLSPARRATVARLLHTGRGDVFSRAKGLLRPPFHRSSRVDDLLFRLLMLTGHYRGRSA